MPILPKINLNDKSTGTIEYILISLIGEKYNRYHGKIQSLDKHLAQI